MQNQVGLQFPCWYYLCVPCQYYLVPNLCNGICLVGMGILQVTDSQQFPCQYYLVWQNIRPNQTKPYIPIKPSMVEYYKNFCNRGFSKFLERKKIRLDVYLNFFFFFFGGFLWRPKLVDLGHFILQIAGFLKKSDLSFQLENTKCKIRKIHEVLQYTCYTITCMIFIP